MLFLPSFIHFTPRLHFSVRYSSASPADDSFQFPLSFSLIEKSPVVPSGADPRGALWDRSLVLRSSDDQDVPRSHRSTARQSRVYVINMQTRPQPNSLSLSLYLSSAVFHVSWRPAYGTHDIIVWYRQHRVNAIANTHTLITRSRLKGALLPLQCFFNKYGVYVMWARVFTCSLDSAKRSFYRAFISLFGKSPAFLRWHTVSTKCVTSLSAYFRFRPKVKLPLSVDL